jgi:predicted nucleic acid-binding protein
MQPPKTSPCGRFIVIDGLHLDRVVFESLATWASERGLRLQDAIQLAVCAFHEGSLAMDNALPAFGTMVRCSPPVPAAKAAKR